MGSQHLLWPSPDSIQSAYKVHDLRCGIDAEWVNWIALLFLRFRGVSVYFFALFRKDGRRLQCLIITATPALRAKQSREKSLYTIINNIPSYPTCVRHPYIFSLVAWTQHAYGIGCCLWLSSYLALPGAAQLWFWWGNISTKPQVEAKGVQELRSEERVWTHRESPSCNGPCPL